MKKFLLFILISLFLAQENQPYPPLDLVSVPTAGTLPKGVFSIETLLMNNGGVLPKVLFGISNKLTFGVSFGVQGFIGTSELEKNKSAPEVQIKYRIFDETEGFPAMVVGLNTQGKGRYIAKHERYEQKAMGVYFMISKNWDVLGNLGFHIGLNKNLFENFDGDEDLNLFFGFDKEINESFSLLCEYNLARDDDKIIDSDPDVLNNIVRNKKGFFNAGLRWSATDNLMLELNVNDILKNNTYGQFTPTPDPNDPNPINPPESIVGTKSMNREIKIIYYEYF